MKKIKKLLVSSLIVLSAGVALASCSNKKAKDDDNKENTSNEVVEDELKISAQPKSEALSAPKGFELSVGVNREDLVQSYQWQINNGTEDDPAWINLDSISARTNKLIKPSTTSNDIDRQYRCIIKDINGDYLFTDPATIEIENSREFVNCSWVAGYAVEAGKTFDLSTTALGTGEISLNEAGDTLTIKDVCLDNSNPIYDYYDCPIGFESIYYNYPNETFKIKVEGTNVVTNTYWRDDSNSGGIAFCFNFLGENNKCKNVIFEGDGTLSITGGTHMIYSNTKVTIDADMNFGKIGSRYTTGVYASEIEVCEDVNIDANLNGFLFQTQEPKGFDELDAPIVGSATPFNVTAILRQENPTVTAGESIVNGDITIKNGARISLISSAPMVSVGTTDFHAISSMYDLNIEGAYIDMILEVNPKTFDENHGVSQLVALQSHLGDIDIYNSQITVKYRAPESDVTVLNGAVIVAETGDVSIDSSYVKAYGNTEGIIGFSCVYANDAVISNSSKVEFDVYSHGHALGFNLQGDFIINNSEAYIKVYAIDLMDTNIFEEHDEFIQNFGIIGCGFNIFNSILSVDVIDVAIAIYVGGGEEPYEPFPGYVPTKITIEFPEGSDYEVNLWNLEGSINEYAYFETIYEYGVVHKIIIDNVWHEPTR